MGKRHYYQGAGAKALIAIGLCFILVIVAVVWYGVYVSLAWVAN